MKDWKDTVPTNEHWDLSKTNDHDLQKFEKLKRKMGVVQFVNKKETLITIAIFFGSLALTERFYYEAGI